MKSIWADGGQPHNAHFLKGLGPKNSQPTGILMVTDGKGCIGL